MSRPKLIWDVATLAAHAGISRAQAKRLVRRLDQELGGRLLLPSAGCNRRWTFYRSAIAKSCPELFEPLDLEQRVDRLEEEVCELRRAQRLLVSAVGAMTREIERLRAGRRRAA